MRKELLNTFVHISTTSPSSQMNHAGRIIGAEEVEKKLGPDVAKAFSEFIAARKAYLLAAMNETERRNI